MRRGIWAFAGCGRNLDPSLCSGRQRGFVGHDPGKRNAARRRRWLAMRSGLASMASMRTATRVSAATRAAVVARTPMRSGAAVVASEGT